jgi:cation transport ATPase
MDCASCSIKVTRAASRLTSVQSINVDYFASKITLEHDPEQVTLDAIARFVSRATGFRVTPLLGGQVQEAGASRLTLPIVIHTNKCLTQEDTDKYTVVPKGRYAEVSFDPRVHPARTVLKDLERFGPSLLPREQASDRREIARWALLESTVRSLVCTICVIPILVLTWGDPNLSFAAIHGTAFALCTVIVALSTSLLLGSVKSLVYLRHADVQLLVAVSVLTAYIFSIVTFALNLAGNDFEDPFFETPALLLALVHIGASVQAYARRLVGSVVDDLQTSQPEQAKVLQSIKSDVEEVSRWTMVDTRLLEYGDVIRVETDEVLAADGIVLSADCMMDESCVTGESIPVNKHVGDLVVAGCTNVGPPCNVHVSRLVHENTAAKMIELVDQAQQTRLPIQDGADRIAAVVLPCALVAAAISLLVWSLVARYVREESAASAGILGLTYAIAVVAVACPCALVLAVSTGVSTTRPNPCLTCLSAGSSCGDHGHIDRLAGRYSLQEYLSIMDFPRHGRLCL